MPDEQVPNTAQTAPPAVEPVDERGVPLKNRIAELERKLQDAVTQSTSVAEQNEQYQRELGRLIAAQQQTAQPQSQAPDILSQFDEPSKQMVRQIAKQVAEEVGYSMMGRAQLTQELSGSQEVRKLAEQHFQTMLSNPYYARQPREALEEIAVLRAKVDYQALQAKAGTQQSAQQLQANANQQLAGNTGLPSTGDNPPQTANDKDKFIREFMADPIQRKFVQGGWKMNPDSPEGQAKLRSIAETAWSGVDLSPKIGLAVQAMGGNVTPQGSVGGTR